MKLKTLLKHISCDCEWRFNSTTCNWNQRWSNDKYQLKGKKYFTCKKDYSLNPCLCICENGKYLQCIANTSVIVSNEILNIADSISTNVTKTISTNVTNFISANITSTVSKSKTKWIVILYTVLLVVTLLSIVAIITQNRPKQKIFGALTI